MSEKEKNNQDTQQGPTVEKQTARNPGAKNTAKNAGNKPMGNTPDAKDKSTATTPPPAAAKKTTDTTTAPKSATPPPTKPAATFTKQPASWPGALALVLSLAALGSSGYQYWQTMQNQGSEERLKAAVNSRVDSSMSAINDVRGSLDQSNAKLHADLGKLQGEMQTRFAAEKANIDELQDRLTKSIQQVNAKQSNSRKDWLIAEAEYLLRLANQRVLMEKTADGALALLTSADRILKETDDVSIYNVRKALAEDIAALEAVPKLDMEGIFLKLASMNLQVKNLRLIPLTEQQPIPELLEQITPETVTESWGAGIKASWAKAMDKLEDLVVVQHRDKTIEPLLSPDQTYYLQQNLHLMLEQAQLALLQRKQDAYDASLSKAEEWLSTYFEAKDGTTISLLKGVKELKSIEVAPSIPSIAGSLGTLKDYLKEMTRLKEEGAK